MSQSLIKKIRVDDLFGKFSHQIPKTGDLGSPAILYGDNGVGKSTVLNIAFHMLSSANNRGHRTALRRIPFRSVTVFLSDGTQVSANRKGDIDSPIIDLSISKNGKILAEWFYGAESLGHFLVDDENVYIQPQGISLKYYKILDDQLKLHSGKHQRRKKTDGVPRGEEEYIDKLDSVAPKIFYLNADRKLDGDSVPDAADSNDIKRLISSKDNKSATDILRASRSLSLTQALDNAARWVNRRAVSGANRGSENTHSAYESILDQISKDYTSSSDTLDQASIVKLNDIVNSIQKDTEDFSKYELAAELKMEKFREALTSGNENTISISARLIEPYVRGLATRIDAVRPLYNVIDNFVSVINDFLSGKRLHFMISQGFFIKDDKGNALKAEHLSSGEQQLLLIFSHVLAAREYPSVFIIDEPEISLNIKWQRKIVRSLLSVAEQSDIQFIFASHSLELISQHSDAVVELGR